MSTDGGVTWTEQTSLPTTSNWTAVAASADGSKLVAVSADGGLYTYSNGTWTLQADAGQRAWSAVDISADGSTVLAGVSGGAMYLSKDGGATWVEDATSAGQS